MRTQNSPIALNKEREAMNIPLFLAAMEAPPIGWPESIENIAFYICLAFVVWAVCK